MSTRTLTIEPTLCHDGFVRGFSFRTYRMFWLHTAGSGHWCVGGRETGKYASRERAEQAGLIWVETGISPAEQTPERVAAARAGRAVAA